MSPPITLPRLLVACASVIASLAATRVQAQSGASFLGLGDLPGGTFSSTASAVSGDGRFVVGLSVSGNGPEATRWHINTDGTINSMLGLNDLAGGSFNSNALGVSLDGSVVVGTSFSGNGQEAFRWVEGGAPMVGLGDFAGGGFISAATGVSVDGSVIAGNGHATQDMDGVCNPIPGSGGYRAFQWTAANGMVSLERPAELNRPQSTVAGISHDGTVIGGNISHDPACNGSLSSLAVRWVDGRVSPIGADRRLTDVSPDGSAFVGATTGVVNGFRWTSSGGFTVIGAAQPQAVSDQGQVVVGWQLAAGTANAFVWDEAQGLRLLKDALISHGVSSVVGWNLQVARGISDDGLTIVGEGINPSGMLEGWIARLPPLDSDGDGLLNAWETQGQGIDINTDGVIDLDLHALGARPDHKDLFVEIDCMSGFAPSNLAPVITAFANAPVTNPDGTSGINLHLQTDDTNIAVSGGWTCEPDVFDVQFGNLKSIFFGTAAQRGSPNSAHILAAKRKAYRYCLYANTGGCMGVARGVHANDFIIFKGNFTTALVCPNSGACDLAASECSTFMHELGHALGLMHGGGDEIYNKPNYLSVMNYLQQLPFNAGSDWALDYSRGSMMPVIEANIDETVFLQDATGHNNGRVTYRPGIDALCPVPACDPIAPVQVLALAYIIGSGPKDLNADGLLTTTGICMDLNYYGTDSPVSEGETPSPCDLMNDHNDWAALQYALVDDSGALAGGPPTDPPVELTVAEVQALHVFLPGPPCLSDIDNSGSVDIDDLLAVISAWGPCAPPPSLCLADIAPLPVDIQVNIDDLLAVISAWGACR